MKKSTEEVLRKVINSDPYHAQFTPLLEEIDTLRTHLAAAERVVKEADQMLCLCDDPSRVYELLDAEECVRKAILDYRSAVTITKEMTP